MVIEQVALCVECVLGAFIITILFWVPYYNYSTYNVPQTPILIKAPKSSLEPTAPRIHEATPRCVLHLLKLSLPVQLLRQRPGWGSFRVQLKV